MAACEAALYQPSGGHPGQGLISLAVMAAFGLIILLAGGSETIRGLRAGEPVSREDPGTSGLSGNIGGR